MNLLNVAHGEAGSHTLKYRYFQEPINISIFFTKMKKERAKQKLVIEVQKNLWFMFSDITNRGRTPQTER